MFSIESHSNPENNPEIVKLVYLSMRNKYTRVSNPDGLTFKEVKSMLSGRTVSAIMDGSKIVGIVNAEYAERRLKIRLDLDLETPYFSIGMIYISKKERGNGYASKVVEHFLKQYKNVIYLAHVSNIASNKVAMKYMQFYKIQSSFSSFETYNVYKIEQ